MINSNSSLMTTYNKITPALKTFTSVSVKYLTITFVLEPGPTHFKVFNFISMSFFRTRSGRMRKSRYRNGGRVIFISSYYYKGLWIYAMLFQNDMPFAYPLKKSECQSLFQEAQRGNIVLKFSN